MFEIIEDSRWRGCDACGNTKYFIMGFETYHFERSGINIAPLALCCKCGAHIEPLYTIGIGDSDAPSVHILSLSRLGIRLKRHVQVDSQAQVIGFRPKGQELMGMRLSPYYATLGWF